MNRFVVCAASWLAIVCFSAATEAADPPTSRTLEVKLSFERDALEGILEKLTAQTGVPFEINKTDLQLEGITKCQSFGCAEREQSLEDFLKWLLAKQNPDGKVVYTVKTNAEGKNVVHIITRAGAEKRREQIFPEFVIEK